MRAFRSTGIAITLLKEDKEKGNTKEKLECRIEGEDSVVVLNIVPSITEAMRRRGFLEEPGFHINHVPARENRPLRYVVYLTRERWAKLTNPEGDPVIDGGWFISRSKYDRISFNYYGL